MHTLFYFFSILLKSYILKVSVLWKNYVLLILKLMFLSLGASALTDTYTSSI